MFMSSVGTHTVGVVYKPFPCRFWEEQSRLLEEHISLSSGSYSLSTLSSEMVTEIGVVICLFIYFLQINENI